MNPAEESAYWDWVASDYDRITAEVYSDLNLDESLAAISDGLHIPVDGVILELGCGPGRLLHHMANNYPMTRFVGVDSSQYMVELASEYEYSNLLVVKGDGRTIPGGPYDGAYTMTMLQHLPPEAQVGYLRELARVLKSGARARIQWVYLGEAGSLSFPTPIKVMLAAANHCGLVDIELEQDRIKPGWAWATLVKP